MDNRTVETSWTARQPIPFEGERARHAVDLTLRCLRGIALTEDVRDLVDRAERLHDEIMQWTVVPPSSEMREAVMRGALALQVAALTVRKERHRSQG
jgi:predicted Fe-S protein YdhL (DUF1289 family)